jgi:AmmeMemoRadiSam system protein A
MPQLSSSQRRALLALARHAILEAVVQERIPELASLQDSLRGQDSLQTISAEPGAAFVTLYVRGHLRGCIGRSERDAPLAETIVQSAIAAALRDPRFGPLGKGEAGNLEIEISVLSELLPISLQEIEIGKHGLLARRGQLRGLLLPQVAVQRRWPPRRFLEETCRKAGLAPEAWREPATELFAFTVEVFSEADFPPGYSSST